MNFKEIEKRVYALKSKAMNFEVYPNKKDYDDYLDMELIKELKLCIKGKIPVEMNEKDFIKVVFIYHRLFKNDNSEFLDKLLKFNNMKLDYQKIIDIMK